MNEIAVAKELVAVANSLFDSGDEGQWEKDKKVAEELRPLLESVYEEAEHALKETEQRMSAFNEPGLRAAFLRGLRAGVKPGGFDRRSALAELGRYFQR